MIQITPQMRILVAVAPVDIRKGIDGLAAICRQAPLRCRSRELDALEPAGEAQPRRAATRALSDHDLTNPNSAEYRRGSVGRTPAEGTPRIHPHELTI